MTPEWNVMNNLWHRVNQLFELLTHLDYLYISYQEKPIFPY